MGGEGGVQLILNEKDNGTFDNGGCRRRASSNSGILCAKAIDLWRASSSDHKYDMNGRDNNEDAA